MIAGVDPAKPGGDKTVITIGYAGAREKNRGLEAAVRWLQAKYPNAEIITRRIDLSKPGEPLDVFHWSHE